MSMYAIITFDLEGADWQTYENVKTRLESIGIEKNIKKKGQTKEIVLPRNLFVGKFGNDEHESAGDLKNYLSQELERIFSECGTEGTYFVFVGSSWAWKKGTFRIDEE